MFLRYRAVACLRQCRPAYVLISEGLMFVGVSNPELISIGEVVKHATRTEKVMNRRGHIFTNRAVESLRIDERLSVIEVLVEGKQKRGFLVSSEWSGKRTFVKLSLLRWFLCGESVPCIENRISNQKAYRTVKIRRTTFGGNLQPCPARPRIQRGIWILINFNLLNRGRCHTRSIRL